jgi:hypothetical protein
VLTCITTSHVCVTRGEQPWTSITNCSNTFVQVPLDFISIFVTLSKHCCANATLRKFAEGESVYMYKIVHVYCSMKFVAMFFATSPWHDMQHMSHSMHGMVTVCVLFKAVIYSTLQQFRNEHRRQVWHKFANLVTNKKLFKKLIC